MRDSGTPKLGNVPAHWQVARLKFRLKGITQGWSPQCEVLPAGHGDWGVLKAGCVNGDTFSPDENKRLPDRETPLPEIEVHPRDVIMSRANTTELVGSAAIVPPDVRPRLLLSDKLYRLDVKAGELMPEFLVYVLRTASARSAFESTASGASNSMQNISQEVVRNLWLPVPPIAEQRSIVARLVDETAHIDTLLAAKARLLDLLTEKRRAIIATAVTCGLDPKVKLRDSGVPWLGKIPAHWPLVPLRYVVSFLSGGTPDKGKAAFWVGGTIPWVSPKDMKVEVIDDSEDHITQEAVEGSATRIVPIGSVLIVVRGMILAHTVPVAVTSGPVTINQDIKALVCGDLLLSDFLRIVLVGQSQLLLSLADSSAHGTKKMETEVLQRLEVPVPTLDEQRAIVAHIARETAKLDAVRAATERTIALLKERRAALIAAAVTGQLDVGTAA